MFGSIVNLNHLQYTRRRILIFRILPIPQDKRTKSRTRENSVNGNNRNIGSKVIHLVKDKCCWFSAEWNKTLQFFVPIRHQKLSKSICNHIISRDIPNNLACRITWVRGKDDWKTLRADISLGNSNSIRSDLRSTNRIDKWKLLTLVCSMLSRYLSYFKKKEASIRSQVSKVNQ